MTKPNSNLNKTHPKKVFKAHLQLVLIQLILKIKKTSNFGKTGPLYSFRAHNPSPLTEKENSWKLSLYLLESNFYQIFHWSSIGEEETGKDRILVPYGETDFFRQVLTFHICTFTGQN
jgi:hypothetical protein